MKKLFYILFTFVLLLIAGGYCLWHFSAPLLADVVSRKVGVPVTIEAIRFDKDSFSIYGLEIENPKEAAFPTALSVKKISVHAPYSTYIDNPIKIDTIALSSVYVNVQFYDKNKTKGNWNTIISNMHTDNTTLFSVERETHIKRLILTDISIDLLLYDGKHYPLSPIDHLEFDNITTEKGIPTEEITEIVVAKIINSIFLLKGLEAIFAIPNKVLETLFSPFSRKSKEAN